MEKTVKLSKGLVLHFVSRDEDEVVVKSSNNRATGMIKTFNKTLNKNKEYSVDFIMKWIEQGFVTIPEKILANQENGVPTN